MSNELRVQIARDLRAIVELCGDLGEEAVARSDDKDLPGGAALLMDGPAANIEAWQHRYETAERLARERAEAGLDGAFSTRKGGRDYAPDQEAELQPLLVLATWEDAIRDERNQPTDLRATVDRAADYIRNSLDWAFAANEYGDQNFLGVDQLSIDLKRCRAMLENLLRDGDRAEWSEVRCIEDKCEEKPRLMKVYGETVADDRHQCPACRAPYDFAEYVSAAKVHAASETAEDAWVTVADAAHSIERPVNTIRSWIRDWKVSWQQTPGFPSSTWVYWAEVRLADLEARRVDARRKARRIA